ncbi:MAG TPA: hypothetical protein VMJ72_00600 [Candidatus Paceibacterota bacterium]|nr:hypothetical protein [Candidatus Paceibacterota bacterium]
MPQVLFRKGDCFKFRPERRREAVNDTGYAYGVVLDRGETLVIIGGGGRLDRRPVHLDIVPKDALPIHDLEWMESVPYEVKLALHCVRVAIT